MGNSAQLRGSRVRGVTSNLRQLENIVRPSKGPRARISPLQKPDLDAMWDGASAGKKTVDAVRGAAASSGAAGKLRHSSQNHPDGEARFAVPEAPKPPASKERKGRWHRMLIVPGAMGVMAAMPKLLSLLYQNQYVRSAVDQAMNLVAALPHWAQTGVWLGAGFGAAVILPKVVRRAAKWMFNRVDRDPLRESYLVNLASAAAWFAAIGFGVFQLGGFAALGVNAGLFGATMALANQDLAKNLASGFQLYRNQEHEYEFDDEVTIWDEKGRLESVNIRFVTLDTSENPTAEFNRVMMPNEKVRSLGITNHSHDEKRDGINLFGAAVFLPLGLTMATMEPLIVAGLWFLGAVLKEVGTAIARKAEGQAQDEDAYKKLAGRSRFLNMLGNVSYIAGLGFILNLFGVPLSGVTTAMGIVSAAAGFWTKEVAGDLTAGLMIAIWRPFEKGEVIKVGKHPQGVVETITPRTIRLRLEDGSAHFVPLEDLMKEKIFIGLKSGTPAAA